MENTSDPLIAVLISGRGSNLRALVEAKLPAPIAVVISSRADAGGLAIAREAGIDTMVLSPRAFPSRDAYDAALVDTLRARAITLVCLAGFMRRVGPLVCDAFPGAILNIHPSLLPSFPGLDAQRQALEHGVRVSGATVHFVTPELDAGPILMQAAVPVEDDDSVETLAERILEAEHRIYPEAVRLVLSGEWRLDGRRIVFSRSDGRAV